MTISGEDRGSGSRADFTGDERTNESNNSSELTFSEAASFFGLLAADMSSSELTGRATFFLATVLGFAKSKSSSESLIIRSESLSEAFPSSSESSSRVNLAAVAAARRLVLSLLENVYLNQFFVQKN
jgi:hypothetical protein